jgi:hypothetical protein
MGFLSRETISNRAGIVQFLPLADKRNIQSLSEYRLVFVSSLNASRRPDKSVILQAFHERSPLARIIHNPKRERGAINLTESLAYASGYE